MDTFNILLNKIDDLYRINTDKNKIENIIKNDELYNNLDIDEQMVINETLLEKFNVKEGKKNNKSFNIMIENKDGIMMSEGEALSSKKNAIILDKISDEEFKRRVQIYEKLRSIILPEQRSPEWFAMRSGKITASDGGAVLGENKHEPQFNFILKKVLGSTFETNLACYHGKKFENVVTLMYELDNDVYTEEFGLLGHPQHYFLGASPDGICSPYCRDKKTLNSLVGRMLEIKCPLMRKIKYVGDIKDNICPIYYWCQVQLQLECCDLDECDFIQCNIEEYSSREEWIEDTNVDCDYKTKKYGLERGVLLELLPIKLTDEDYDRNYISEKTIYDKTSFIYQPKIDMTCKEIDDWILKELSELQNDKQHLRLHRVIYWRLIEKNCTLIKRDKEWFSKNLEKLRTMWSYVEYLRDNLDVIEEWKKFIDVQTKKYNEKIMEKLRELINKKKNLDCKVKDKYNKDNTSSEEDLIIIKSKNNKKNKK